MLVFAVFAFIVILVLGAMAGGKSFGETVSNGCGCVFMIALMAVVGIGVFTGTRCLACAGTGKCSTCRGSGTSMLIMSCATCTGSGKCSTCKGSGNGWLSQVAGHSSQIAILNILQQDRQIGKSGQSKQSIADSIASLDLKDCPAKFREAYQRHTQAWMSGDTPSISATFTEVIAVANEYGVDTVEFK